MNPNLNDDPLSFPVNSPRSFWSYLLELVITIGVCFVLVMIIHSLIARPHKVSGSSMVPTFRTDDFILTYELGYHFYPPKRGDIIVLKNPQLLSEDFIKRAIGLPGETVKVEGGGVWINGLKLKEPYLDSSVITPPGAFLQEGVELQIPKDKYIVMGDNRLQSSDSREWGFVPKEDIIGQVFIRYWPPQKFGLIPTTVKY